MVGLMGSSGSFDQQPDKTRSIGRVVVGVRESESSNGGLVGKQKFLQNFEENDMLDC